MAIQPFGSDPAKWHLHLHILATDGPFRDTGTQAFPINIKGNALLVYVMKDVDLKPLEELFRAEVFTFLKKEGKISDEFKRGKSERISLSMMPKSLSLLLPDIYLRNHSKQHVTTASTRTN